MNETPPVSTLEHVRQALSLLVKELEDPFTLPKYHTGVFIGQEGFRVARRVQGAIAELGLDPKNFCAEQFQDPVLQEFGFEILSQFLMEWQKVKYPEGINPINWAISQLSESEWRVPMPDVVPAGIQDAGSQLATAIFHLQERNGGGWAPLSSRDAGRIIQTSHVTAAALLTLLVRYEVLEVLPTVSRKFASVYKIRTP